MRVTMGTKWTEFALQIVLQSGLLGVVGCGQSTPADCPQGLGFMGGPLLTTGRKPYSVALGDLNGDGKADLAVPNLSSNTVSALLNQGEGTFAVKVSYPTGAGPTSVVLGDLNGDDKADLAVANADSNTVSVLLNQGN